MSDLHLERHFPVSAERLFDWVTKPENLTKWWGPEGMHCGQNQLDFTRLGPWFAVIESETGEVYKVSGQVTHVDVPLSVGFTWAWHDPQDQRGPESHVTFTIHDHGHEASLSVNHRDLPDAEAAQNHKRGWTSSLQSLANHLQ